MISQMTEILISKYLDSEITPAESCLLDQELQRDPEARAYLKAMRDLRQNAQMTLAAEVLEPGRSLDDIFARARQAASGWRHRRLAAPPWMRVAATLAAGFLLGLGAFALWSGRSAATPQTTHPAVAPVLADATGTAPSVDDNRPDDAQLELAADEPAVGRPPTELHPDIYRYTDPRGTEYLIESYRQSDIRPAAYGGDL